MTSGDIVKVVSKPFDDKVIGVWMIIYDGDASQTYMFGDFDKVLASIESSIRGYIGDELSDDKIYDTILNKVRENSNKPCIPIRVNNLQIVLYYWELDDSHPIHRVLGECFDVVDSDLKYKISSLFSDRKDSD